MLLVSLLDPTQLAGEEQHFTAWQAVIMAAKYL